MQLDLFAHSADVSRSNAVIAALRARDAVAMRAAIDQVHAHFPGDGNLNNFEHLYFELLALEKPGCSATAIARQVERIETRLLPPLQKLIGSDTAQRWIEPVYGELARAVAGQAFNRSLANGHAAGLFLRAGELALARAAVAEIPSWRRIPEPLSWMAEIALREGVPDDYWPLVAELAWIAPALLAAVIPRAAPATVLRLCREFSTDAELDDDENDESTWFPAWLLVEHPELLPCLRTVQPNDSIPARSAALLIDLLIGERKGSTQTLVDKRKQLRDIAPSIFALYLARR
ncbi:hypothetical protein [Propionivibrio sp.]|uniref:hypothetical protein n=1 Tax=Propionivibrio sp. TaxID=2212460 RepID=UPI003BF2AB1A